jgi:hypothetical protein
MRNIKAKVFLFWGLRGKCTNNETESVVYGREPCTNTNENPLLPLNPSFTASLHHFQLPVSFASTAVPHHYGLPGRVAENHDIASQQSGHSPRQQSHFTSNVR